MVHTKWKNKRASLRHPLYSAPPGSPERDPGLLDEDLVQIKRDRPQYLPPYRYDKDEQPKNIYRTSDEAYCTIARSLACQYECCKHAYNVHQVILNNLTPAQCKLFADAHMERTVNLPMCTDKGESPIHSAVRMIDNIYGVVFLEYYASNDGNLIQSQIESLGKAMGFETKEENCEVPSKKSPCVKETVIECDSLVSEISIVRNPSESSRHKSQDVEKGENSSPLDCHKSSFDKLYHDVSTKEESTIKPTNSTDASHSSEKKSTIKPTNSTDASHSSETTADQTSHSKLRQEILREILQIMALLRAETDKDNRDVYSRHLNTLRAKFYKYTAQEESEDEHTSDIEEKVEVRNASNRIQVLQPQHRVRTNDLIAGSKTMPDEGVTMQKRSLVYEFEHGTSRSIPIHLANQVPDLENGLRFIRIVAPSNMFEGYTFEAKYRDWQFLAKVPKGGVRKGDIFVSPMLNPSGASKQIVIYESILDGMDVPKGRWRDGLFHCFKDPLFALSFLCPQVALSQVRSRILFFKSGKAYSQYSPKFLLFFTVSVISLNIWTVIALTLVVNQPELWVILTSSIPLGLLDLFLLCNFFSMVIRTRREVRETFQIQERRNNDGAWKDLLVGLFCSCCSISQMGRHTADYKTYREQWLSTTGLPRHLEKIIPKHSLKEATNDDDSQSF